MDLERIMQDPSETTTIDSPGINVVSPIECCWCTYALRPRLRHRLGSVIKRQKDECGRESERRKGRQEEKKKED